MSVGSRLREERERCGLTQERMAQAGGVSKRSQIDYEQEKIEMKSAYLAGLAEAGIDIGYVLTGRRSVTGSLSEAELTVVSIYRRLDAFAQQSLLVIFERLASGAKKK
jgi:transcriptional regulator with XRE-family HTH domain